ncbi:uncharacterized protein LOC115401997 isoform X1 [Salarias fasciatus]|uniref:Uncharacterized LOC115401997 n=1 Tax=Salarias fasciatus TaxID=181472 RepID=A0A672GQ15_SALFA|nr:uncharacterized protein LOC115401997 isoform X1 [Salarias fasciatus]
MDRHRYFIFNQKGVLSLGIVQLACASICVICGFMDAAFRKNTPLSSTRTPVWGGLLMASPAVLSLFASQKKHSVLVSAMVAAAGLSCVAAVFTASYACLTLTYGEEDEEVFFHDHHPDVRFVLHRMVKGANATVLLCCGVGLLLSGLIAYTGCRSLPLCACYDSRTGLETLVPQSDPGDTEMVCTYRAGGDERLFNSPPSTHRRSSQEEDGAPSRPPPYARMS